MDWSYFIYFAAPALFCWIGGACNHYGSLRIGASAGSDTNKFLGGLHLGYEHNYVLRAGWTLYWQVKSDVMIKGADVLRAGVVLGVKLPMK